MCWHKITANWVIWCDTHLDHDAWTFLNQILILPPDFNNTKHLFGLFNWVNACNTTFCGELSVNQLFHKYKIMVKYFRLPLLFIFRRTLCIVLLSTYLKRSNNTVTHHRLVSLFTRHSYRDCETSGCPLDYYQHRQETGTKERQKAEEGMPLSPTNKAEEDLRFGACLLPTHNSSTTNGRAGTTHGCELLQSWLLCLGKIQILATPADLWCGYQRRIVHRSER